jgi:hypothetical protein
MQKEFKTSEAHRRASQKYQQKPGVIERRRELNRNWIAKNRERYNEAKAEYRFKLKIAAIRHYSNGSMSCTRCGFNADLDALCLDHINDDGAAHRKQLNISNRLNMNGTTIYERLKAIGWMDGLQVLCANCNMVKELRRKRGRTSAEMLDATQKPTRWRKQPYD